jgi:inositol-polyphosphate multikinase
MEDMASEMKHPVVIDIKIGRITYDPEASIEKITRQKLKYPPVEKIGFQLVGLRVFDTKTQTFTHYDKIFGRALSESDLIHGIALFYQFHTQNPKRHVIEETIKYFEDILDWFNKQKIYHFYSSSLIVAYDANTVDVGDLKIKVKMADFAHVFPAKDTLDENYIFGIKKLIKLLRLLLSDDYKFKDVRK